MATYRDIPDADEFTPDDWLDALAGFFDDFVQKRTIKRGREYALDGHVLDIAVFSEGTMEGHVRGSERKPYDVHFTVDHESGSLAFSGMCSCPVFYRCKHAYAIALRVLAEIYKYVPAAVPWAKQYLPKEWQDKRARLPLVTFEGDVFWRADAEAPAEVQNKPPWWREFLRAQAGRDLDHALLRGLNERLPLSPGYLRPLAHVLWQGATGKLDVLQRFEQVIRTQSGWASEYIEEDRSGLQAWLASDEFQRMLAAEQRTQIITHLERWLTKGQPSPASVVDDVAFVWALGERCVESGLPKLVFQVLLTSKKLQRSPRNGLALENLRREVAQGRRVLPNGQDRLLAWITNHQPIYGHTNAAEFDVSDAMTWLTTWAHRGLLTWSDTGERVCLNATPAHLTLTQVEGRALWAMRREGAEAPTPLNEVTLVIDDVDKSRNSAQTVTIFSKEGNTLRRIETGGVPLMVLRTACKSPELPLEDIRQHGLGHELLEHLRRLGRLDDTPFVQEVPVEPRLDFCLKNNNELHMRVIAHGADGMTFVREAPNVWTLSRQTVNEEETTEALPATESPEDAHGEAHAVAENPKAIAQRPREADIARVERWLEALMPAQAARGRMPSGLPSITWRIDDIAAFLEAWEQRPARLHCYGNKRMHDLITLRTPPAFKYDIKASGVQWLTVSVETQSEIDDISFEEVEAALRTQDSPHILLPKHGRFRREELETYQNQMRTFAELGIPITPGDHRVHVLQLGAANLDALPDRALGMEHLLEQAEKLRKDFAGVPTARLPKTLSRTLRPYQRTGVNFCVWACRNFGGAILADDMGLGKTLQVLATLRNLRGKRGSKKPCLVVCPASVTHNWEREAARFTPEFKTLVLQSGAQRQQQLQELDAYDLVIKNYALARRDIDLLREQNWHVVCVDEAQAIKNPDAAITQALKSLDAEYRIALTGTPIENRLTDLWSITDFAVPGYLPDRNEFEKGVGSTVSALEYRRLRARLRPVLLRRLKSEVAPELPPRIEERLDCAMTAAQRKAYLVELKNAQRLLNQAKNKKVTGQDRIQILAALTRLRQLCCDPALRGMPKAGSGKVEVFLDRLQDLIDGGHKVLVFSQFVKMLDILKAALEKRGIRHYTLTGKTTNRAELVARYETDLEPSAFLISLKAGGSGLNLVSASYVILFDPWWNPAVEAQAIDRTHRIGQDKTVVAYRLVTEDSIEERILELQEQKRALVANVLEADAFNRSLTREDFAFILE